MAPETATLGRRCYGAASTDSVRREAAPLRCRRCASGSLVAPVRRAARWRRGWRRSASRRSIGSRSRYRALEVVDGLKAQWAGRELTIDAADNEGAADADLVVIATPWDGATQTAQQVEGHLRGKVVDLDGQRPHPDRQGVPAARPAAGLGGRERPGRAARGAWWRPAFHHVPAKELGDLDHPIESDVLICSDHPEATEATADLVAKIPNMRPLDCGELSHATPIESFTAVLLQLNVRYKTRVAVKFTSIPE